MTAYADTCTRVYGPHGSTAHLSPPDTALAPLCPASARPPRDGWLGTRSAAEREWAASLPLCKHCVRAAAAIDAAGGDLAAPQTPAGGASSADRADGTNVPPAGPLPEPLEPLPDPEDPAVRRAAQRGVWKRLLAGHRAGLRGDQGRRNRARRGQAPEYRPGQNRSGGQS